MGMGDKRFPRLAARQSLSRWPEIVSPVSGKRKMRVAYFIGCATNLIYSHLADSTINVLTHNGVEVVIPRKQACCGIPVYSSGDFDTAKGLAEINLRSFSNLGVDCIVTDCSSCSSALKHDIAELLDVGPFDVPAYDLTEFLANVIYLRKDFAPVPLRVTYHDPCHLKRSQGITSEPRSLMTIVPEVEFVEMAESDRCCGGAGTFAYTHHDLSRKVGARKVERIRETGARYVATPCPACRMQLDDLLAHEGLATKVIHPVEILDRAYGNETTWNCGDAVQTAAIPE
jgi:glycolate oxidase iron-sulfur subunit